MAYTYEIDLSYILLLSNHPPQLMSYTNEIKNKISLYAFMQSVLDLHVSICTSIQPSPKRQILDFSKLKEFADENFKFDQNGRKFYECVENTVGKGEIARYEQFLLFPLCFQKTCTVDT